MLANNSFASPSVQSKILSEFTELRKQVVPEGCLGGKGFPDPDILPFCDWLNSFDGIYTLQSCAGHRTSASEVLSQATLWIWMNARLLTLFQLRANQLAQEPLMERVKVVYTQQGEFVELIFKGNENELLSESLGILKDFLSCLLEDGAKWM